MQDQTGGIANMIYQPQIAREKDAIEAQIQVLLFAWVFTKQQSSQAVANQKLTYNLQQAFVMYLMNANQSAWEADPQIVKECYLLLSIREDILLENPAKIIENNDVFPFLMQIYLLATAPSQTLHLNVTEIVEKISKRDLKRYRIDQRLIREWLLPNGLQKYQFNFIKCFATEFVSYHELNLVKCLSIKMRNKQ
jgi:hypothetical protein